MGHAYTENMENDLLRCLICEDPYPQKGVTFFKFPREETRFKAWVQAVSPILDFLQIKPEKLKESGRICGRHFKEKDFINKKRDSLIHTACPFIGVPDNVPVDVEFELKIVETLNDKNLPIVEKVIPDSDYDTFKCGRCKAQFSLLADFFNHKQTDCKLNNNNNNIIEHENSLLDNLALTGGTFLLNFDNGIPLETSPTSNTNNLVGNENDENQNDIVSFIVSDNSLLIGNPLDISLLTSQLLLTSNVQNDNIDILPPVETDPVPTSLLLTTNEEPQSSLILTTGLPNSNNLLLTTDISDENGTSLLLTTENQIENDSVIDKGLNGQDIILNLINSNGNGSDCAILNNLALIPSLKKDKGESNNKPECSFCGKKFKKPFSVLQHERTHTGEKPFQCIICGRAFSQKVNVRKHMIRHKVWPKAKQTLRINLNDESQAVLDQESLENNCYSCQYCSSTFETYYLHKKHMAEHVDQKVYRCIQKNCNETFRDLDDFLSHSENHPTAEFQCHVCFKVYTSLEELGSHQYEHGGSLKDKNDSQTQKFKCEKCYANFKSAETLKNHEAVESHHYECPQCKMVFNSERFLRRHLLSHLDPSKSKFKCEKCKKTFRTERYLLNHSFIHSSDKPYSCEKCSKKFASAYRLRRHLALHSGQYFECPFKNKLGCNKKFYRKDKLSDHVAVHSNVRFKSCQLCGKNFSSLTKLNLHVKRDHANHESNKQVLKCLNCSQTFRKERQLSQHHCTVGERKFKSRNRNRRNDEDEDHKNENPETVSNIEIIMVPFVSGGKGDARQYDN